MPEVLVLCGPPAAGKSTVAQALAERYDRVAHIPVEALRHLVTPTGYVPPGRAGYDRQTLLAIRNACCLAANFLVERIAVIIEDVLTDSAQLETYVKELQPSGARLHCVRLLPSLEVCRARNQAREEGRVSPQRLEQVWRAVADARLGGVTLDSSLLSAHETADRVQAVTTSGDSLIWQPG